MQSQAAKVVELNAPSHFHREQRPELSVNFRGTRAEIREFAAQEFEAMARKLRSGELDGARCQWRNDGAELVKLTISALTISPDGRELGTVQLTTVALEQVKG